MEPMEPFDLLGMFVECLQHLNERHIPHVIYFSSIEVRRVVVSGCIAFSNMINIAL
jgi:hypothetical protein